MSVHRQSFVNLVRKRGWTRGVELGVDKGILFRMLLQGVPELTLTGVDLFPDLYRSRRVFDLADEHPGRARILSMSTDAAADLVPDDSQDFVFIDADHSYEAVAADIARWRPKVREGGWLGGHDYDARRFPGVVKAVREVFADPEVYAGTIWGVPC